MPGNRTPGRIAGRSYPVPMLLRTFALVLALASVPVFFILNGAHPSMTASYSNGTLERIYEAHRAPLLAAYWISGGIIAAALLYGVVSRVVAV